MGKNPFGWGYPAGAEHDPNAPYNQPDEPEDCPVCHGENVDENGVAIYDGVFCSEKCEAKYESTKIGPEPDDDDCRDDYEGP